MSDSMRDILTPFLSILQLYASSHGSGLAAFRLIDYLRRRFPKPAELPSGKLRIGSTLLYTPYYTRLLAILVAILISIGCNALIGYVSGLPTRSALTLALVAALTSQTQHAVKYLAKTIQPPADLGSAAATISVDLSRATFTASDDVREAIERTKRRTDAARRASYAAYDRAQAEQGASADQATAAANAAFTAVMMQPDDEETSTPA